MDYMELLQKVLDVLLALGAIAIGSCFKPYQLWTKARAKYGIEFVWIKFWHNNRHYFFVSIIIGLLFYLIDWYGKEIILKYVHELLYMGISALGFWLIKETVDTLKYTAIAAKDAIKALVDFWKDKISKK